MGVLLRTRRRRICDSRNLSASVAAGQPPRERWERQAAVVLYVLAQVAVVVGVDDVLFFRHEFWERLIVNVGIVLVFAAFGLRFLKRP